MHEALKSNYAATGVGIKGRSKSEQIQALPTGITEAEQMLTRYCV
jgi:hypothetical protein